MKALTLFLVLLSSATITSSSGSLPPGLTQHESKPGNTLPSKISPRGIERRHAVADSAAVLLHHFGHTEPPSIVRHAHPTNVTASKGRTAHLRCRIHNLGQKSVSWVRHSDVSLISVGKYKYIQDSRFHVINEFPNHQDWELAIKDVKLKDEGLYECQVNTLPPLHQPFFLTVVDPFTEILGSKDVFFIDQHSAINLTCVVHSPEPPAHLFWMHNEKLVISRPGLPVSEVRSAVHVIDGRSEMVQQSRPGSTLSSLLIRNAKPSDSGKYVCNPSNTGPAQITVQVLDGESTDALQTSGLSTFTASKPTLSFLYTFSAFLIYIYR